MSVAVAIVAFSAGPLSLGRRSTHTIHLMKLTQSRLLSALVLCGIGLFAGCNRRHEAAAGLNRPDNAVGTTNGSVPALSDGFEQVQLADFWLPGNYGSGLYMPGAIKSSTNYARSGGHSVEVTVREGDVEQAGDSWTRVERAELDSGHFALRGREAWYGFSLLVPKGFPIVDTRLVISSCKQSDVSRPITAQRYRNGKHTLTVEAQGQKEEYQLPPITHGQWVDMIYHVRYSTGKDGLVEVWMDGKRVVAYSGPAAEPGAKDAFYNKVGLYRDRLKQPMTMYFDSYTLGADKDSVDPARIK